MGILTTVIMAGGAAAAIPVGSYLHAADSPKADPIHGSDGDVITSRPQVTKCIVIAICALIVTSFLAICLWRFIRHRRRRRRRRTDVEIATVHRNRRRASRRRRYREPPPPYSAAAFPEPLTTRYLEENRMATIDGIEDRGANGDSDLPRVPAPAYKL
ncbi:hypothetical protein TWF506_002346 [Arthrobotrys conoides]|uniref:Uncharacterized protein n=1 Tax=Arthrobotrys conoides TaxID=74498 RepID=A0AAN8MZJ1_9PEZI